MFSVTAMIFQTPMAMLSDRIGRKRSVLISMGIYFLGTTLCSIAQNITQLVLFRAIQGSGAYAAILLAIISDTFTAKDRSQAISFFMISLTGGYLLGSILGGLLVTIIGPRGVFLFNSVMVGIAIMTVLVFLPETHTIRIQQETQKKTRTFHFLWHKGYLFGLFMNMVKSFLLFGTLTYQLWLYRKGFQLAEIYVSLIIIPATLIYMAGTYIAPRIAQKVGTLNLIQYSCIAFSVFSGALLITYNLYWFLVFSTLNSFSIGLIEPEITSFCQNYIPDEERGFGNGVFNTVGYLFRALGEIILPTLSDLWGYYGVYGLVLSICIMLSLSVLIYRLNQKRFSEKISHITSI